MKLDITKINNTFLCLEILVYGSLEHIKRDLDKTRYFDIIKKLERFEDEYWHQYNGLIHTVKTFSELYNSDPNIDVHEEMLNDELNKDLMGYITTHIAGEDVEREIKKDLIKHFGEKDGSYTL